MEPVPHDDRPQLPDTVGGTLHIHVAFDWGEELRLDEAQRLAPAELHALARRPRTPSSVQYRPTPLRYRLEPITFDLPGLEGVPAALSATVFDLAAVSLSIQLPFRLAPAALIHLTDSLSNPERIVQAARKALEPLHARLLPAIERPQWSELSEEYFVFQFSPGELPRPEQLLKEHAAWIAALVRLEDNPMSPEEVAEAVRLRISYAPDDLFVPEWSAALLIDRECEETLQTIEYANLQLLEFRHIDTRLDDRLAVAYKEVHPQDRSSLPFFKSYARQLRDLGELRMDAHDVFERTGNVLKLVGDQYLARVYQMLANRFHLAEWQRNIERSLGVAQSAYDVVSNLAATTRAETLEWIIVVLILVEVAMGLWKH